MASKVVVRAHIDEHLKEEASVILASIGLTVSDAFRLLLNRVVHDKALPFDVLIPNETTIATMRDARAGKVVAVNSVEDLIADLNAKD